MAVWLRMLPSALTNSTSEPDGGSITNTGAAEEAWGALRQAARGPEATGVAVAVDIGVAVPEGLLGPGLPIDDCVTGPQAAMTTATTARVPIGHRMSGLL
jgi:hypothetical protein